MSLCWYKEEIVCKVCGEVLKMMLVSPLLMGLFLPGDFDSSGGGVIITTQARVFGIFCLKRNIAFMYPVIPLTVFCFVFNMF